MYKRNRRKMKQLSIGFDHQKIILPVKLDALKENHNIALGTKPPVEVVNIRSG